MTVVPKNCRRRRAVCARAASPPPLPPPPSPLMAEEAEVRLARDKPTLLARVVEVLDRALAVVAVAGAADAAAGADNA